MKSMIFMSMVMVLYMLLVPLFANLDNILPQIEQHSIALETEPDLRDLIEEMKDRELVLLGEASHGTSEFYTWRREISKLLIKESDVNFIVVEGDWHSCYKVNQYVKGYENSYDSARQLLIDNFNRWPQWMWANEEVLELVEWLREYNLALDAEQRVGFYGMDVYDQWQSMNRVRKYLRQTDIAELVHVKSNYDCFSQYDMDEWAYARAVYFGADACDEEMREVVERMKEYEDVLIEECHISYFDAKQNAYVVKNAEKYYRTAVADNNRAWNKRVDHMSDTVLRLKNFYSEDAKGIVWAHNTHVGDARATSMAQRNRTNIGQLFREQLGEEAVFILGFATYEGAVMAGAEWGKRRQIMDVPAGMKDSLEDLLAKVEIPSFYVLLENLRIDEALQPIGHRAIGVVYDPSREHLGNYVPTIWPYRYDAFIFLKQTKALNPLHEQ